MDRDLLTIITPIKNSLKFLESHMKRLMSISSDLGADLLVIDNNDDESELNYVRQLAKSFNHINIIYEKNSTDLGVHGSLQKALQMVTTQYVTFVAADDIIFKNYIVRALEVLRADQTISLVWGRGYVANASSGRATNLKLRTNPFPNLGERKVSGNPVRALLCNYPVDTGLVVRTNEVLKVGGYSSHEWFFRIQEMGSGYILDTDHFVNGKHADQESKRMKAGTEQMDVELSFFPYIEKICRNEHGVAGLLAARLFNAARFGGGDYLSALGSFLSSLDGRPIRSVRSDAELMNEFIYTYVRLIMYECILEGEVLKYNFSLETNNVKKIKPINSQINSIIAFAEKNIPTWRYSSALDIYRDIFS